MKFSVVRLSSILIFTEGLHTLRQDTTLSTGTALARELLGIIFFAPLHRGSHFEALLEDAGASRGLRLALRRRSLRILPPLRVMF